MASVPVGSLLLTPTYQTALITAFKWGWQDWGELRMEFRRPDNGEKVRFAPDTGGASLRGLRSGTIVYLVQSGPGHAVPRSFDWHARTDAALIRDFLACGHFIEGDPLLSELPRTPKKDISSEARRFRQMIRNLMEEDR